MIRLKLIFSLQEVFLFKRKIISSRNGDIVLQEQVVLT